MATRLGVDVGGTFTDLVFYNDQSGEVRVAKTRTMPTALQEGVIKAIAAAAPPTLLRSAQFFLHGTTVGLNALLERKGAVVGLLATRGFRDILEIRRGDRDEVYNLFWKPPAPLVPRRLRLPVTERIRADGQIHTPFQVEDVGTAVELFQAEGVTAVAVAFMNAYANPEHELAAEQALRKFGFKGEISLSHRISGEYREYERTCTTVIDAYVRAKVATYLRQLEESLRQMGFGGTLLVTRPGGGSITFAEAEERPFETILSGPVGGAEGAAELARLLDLGEVITADVGGTSFDTSFIAEGRPHVLYEGRVVGLPVQTPWVDVRSIGAGGGSIAYVDVGGLLRVGPQSAGAVPGPACYGNGGTEPTVTDAAFALGMLGEGELAGNIRLDLDLAQAALARLSQGLKLDTAAVARGVITIVTTNMANAIREITVAQGQDPRRARLMPFGGAGPAFATLLARELGIREIVIPPYAGNFSAWGLLGADITQAAARTRIMRLSLAAIELANQILVEMFVELEARGSALNGHERARHVALEMRYTGQEYTLAVPVETEAGQIHLAPAAIADAFTQMYERTYGHTLDDEAEIVSIRATLRTPLPRRAGEHLVHGEGPSHHEARTRPAYSFTAGRWLNFALLERASLKVGTSISGPAIILEDTATTYLDAGFETRVHSSGCLLVVDKGVR